jgi:hypothetical protein
VSDLEATVAEPFEINRGQVYAALEALGLGNLDDIHSVTIGPDMVQVTRIRRHPEGHLLVAGAGAAKVTTTIELTS